MIKRLSEKRSKSGKPFLKRSAIKRKHRKPSETLRIYGGKKRIEFIKSLECAACGVRGFSENAHVAPPSEKGTGYKADAKWIVPLCGPHPSDYVWGIVEGCHQWYDEKRSQFDELFPGFDPSTEASRVQKLWELQGSTA